MGADVPVTIQPTGRFTSVALPRHWHVACLAEELPLGGRAPVFGRQMFGRELFGRNVIGRTVLGVPLVLFRDHAGRPTALLDRCPHRNVPLSLGRSGGGEIECRYHGWRFDGGGHCTAVPGLDEPTSDKPIRQVPAFPVIEQDGLIWVVPSSASPQVQGPPSLIGVGDPGYRTITLRLDVPGPMLAALENALDVPHTSFLHRGLFRGRRERVPVGVTIRHGPDRVEAVFEGEPVPPGVVGRLLSPEGGVVEHTDRFVVPSLAQVEYRLGSRHVALNAVYTPVDDTRCVLHAAAAFRLPIPTAVARTVVVPFARWILRQDNWVLRQQRDNVERFGGERYVNTPIDLLGPHILRLLRRHERGETATDSDVPADETLTLLT